MDRRSFLKSLGLITGGLALGGLSVAGRALTKAPKPVVPEFPVARKVFSKTLANDLVPVQPMAMPVGKLFYMNPLDSKGNMSDCDIDANWHHLEDLVKGDRGPIVLHQHVKRI